MAVHDAIEEGDAELDAMHRALEDADELPQLPGAAMVGFSTMTWCKMVRNGAKWCKMVPKNIKQYRKIMRNHRHSMILYDFHSYS